MGGWGFALAMRGVLQLRLSVRQILHVTFRCSLAVSISDVYDELLVLFVVFMAVLFSGIANCDRGDSHFTFTDVVVDSVSPTISCFHDTVTFRWNCSFTCDSLNVWVTINRSHR